MRLPFEDGGLPKKIVKIYDQQGERHWKFSRDCQTICCQSAGFALKFPKAAGGNESIKRLAARRRDFKRPLHYTRPFNTASGSPTISATVFRDLRSKSRSKSLALVAGGCTVCGEKQSNRRVGTMLARTVFLPLPDTIHERHHQSPLD